MFLKLLFIYGLFHFDSQSDLKMFRCNQWWALPHIISYFRKLKTRTFCTNLRTKLFCNTKSYSWNLFGFAAYMCSRFYYNFVAPHHGRRFPIQKINTNRTFSYLIYCNFWWHVVCLIFLIWHVLSIGSFSKVLT